jgi:thioredoxin 1
MLELYTPWCPTCVKMKPVVEDLAARCAGNGVRIDTVDVSQDENERIAVQYGVRAVPTFLFLDENGVEAERLVGAQTAMDLRRGLKALGGTSCGGPISTAQPGTFATKEG